MSRRDRIKDLYASTAENEKLAMANLSAVSVGRSSERVSRQALSGRWGWLLIEWSKRAATSKKH